MAVPTGAERGASIHPDTTMGTVRLTVSDLARSREFYERAIGLVAVEREDGTVALGPGEGAPSLIELRGDAGAPALDRHRTGLFHLAILLPTRHDLAVALARLARARWRLDGASDHLVSEALYLSDPDGNGIEIYRDRARTEWPRSDGAIQMASIPLDLDGVLAELGDDRAVPAHPPADTVIGHVHLRVADLDDAEAFYSGALGFEVTVRGYPGALFVSAGGYHHHLGLNTWHSAGAAAPADGSIGLRSFDVVLPDAGALAAVLERARAAGVEPQATGEPSSAVVRDPSGNAVVLLTADGR